MRLALAALTCVFVIAPTLQAQQPPPETPTCPIKDPRPDCRTAPRATYSPNPEYSEYARKKRLRGSVILSLTVQPDGSVADVKVERTLEKSLDAKAIEAVRTWRFEPSMYEGHAIAYPTKVE